MTTVQDALTVQLQYFDHLAGQMRDYSMGQRAI